MQVVKEDNNHSFWFANFILKQEYKIFFQCDKVQMTFFEILLFLGNTPGANLLTTIFGSTTNRYYESTGEYLYIRFTSDNAVEKSGFSLQYFSLFSTGKITFTLIIPLTCIVNNVNTVGSEKNFPDFCKQNIYENIQYIQY